MKCPKCGLTNPDIAQRCDCGYDFPSGQMKSSYLPSGGTLFGSDTKREYANVLTRFGAILIDSLILVPLLLPVHILSTVVENGGATEEPSAALGLVILVSYLGAVVFGIWNTVFRMGRTGQSLGRKFLNIAVLDDDGNPIGPGRAFLREFIGRFISSLVCYLGYLNAFWDDRKQMWHDKMANCYVYYVEDSFS